MKPNSIPSAGTKAEQRTDVEETSVSPFFAKPNVMRRLFKEMTYEKDMVNCDPKYTKSFQEGYEEAVRCMGVVIKQFTGYDVRNGA